VQTQIADAIFKIRNGSPEAKIYISNFINSVLPATGSDLIGGITSPARVSLGKLIDDLNASVAKAAAEAGAISVNLPAPSREREPAANPDT
jgi:hypothetical protein